MSDLGLTFSYILNSQMIDSNYLFTRQLKAYQQESSVPSTTLVALCALISKKGLFFFSSVLSVREVLNFELLALVLEKVLQIIRGKEQKREKIETILQAL